MFLLTSPFHGHFIVFTSSVLGLSQKQFTRVIMWLTTLNAWLFLSFEIQAKLFLTRNLGFGQPNLI